MTFSVCKLSGSAILYWNFTIASDVKKIGMSLLVLIFRGAYRFHPIVVLNEIELFQLPVGYFPLVRLSDLYSCCVSVTGIRPKTNYKKTNQII